MISLQRLRPVSKLSRAFLAVLLSAIAPACADSNAWVEARRYSMGTWVDTIYAAPDSPGANSLAAELDQILGRYAVDYYAWSDGELARLNASLQAGESFRASAALSSLLERAKALSAISEGHFDPAVGAVVEAWGFHSAQSEPAEPSSDALQNWRNDRASIADLLIEQGLISAGTRNLTIDLGGIAKGAIVDQMLHTLGAAGVEHALVNAGGDVRVIGRRGERRWSIGIQAPRSANLLGRIELEDGEAAFTSGDYERFFDTDGERRHHLIDPASGLPAGHTSSVTVIAASGTLADAAATAIFVAGPDHWRRVANALGVTGVLRVDAHGRVEMTDAMRERVRMQGIEETATIDDGARRATL